MAESQEKKSFGSKLVTMFGAVGALAGALAIVPLLYDGSGWLASRWAAMGTVELPGSYEGERWRRAAADDMRWLEDEWCFPSLGGFRSRFKVEGNKIYRQNQANYPNPTLTAWEEAEVYQSNNDILRLSFKNDWPVAFISAGGNNRAEFHENGRSMADNGSISSGKKYLALSCTRCTVSRDGYTYSCNKP